MGFAWSCYLIAIIIAILFVIVYAIATFKNDSKNVPKKTIVNRGEPISGGTKYFKLVNK